MLLPMQTNVSCLVGLAIFAAMAVGAEPIAPRQTVSLFNGTDFTGLTRWLKEAQREDPRSVFRAVDGMIHLSGEGNGYVATEKEYRDYRLVVEYKWGQRTSGGKYVRNSGILLHITGPDGGAGGAWPSCIECQLAQGCVGDLIVIRGKDAAGETIPVQVAAETELSPDGRRHRWKAGGELKTFPPTRGQLWWSRHDWDFKELLDTRGKDDIESPLGEWTRVECIAAGERLSVLVNGQKVNECRDVFPTAGRIALQCEGFEIYFRKFELQALETK
jgi:3-keto-disaccharide hydrolase